MCHQPGLIIIIASVVQDEKDQTHAVMFPQLLPSQTGHMVTGRTAQPAVTVPLDCRYGSRRKQTEEEESVFSPSVLLAPVHEVGRGNLRNFARAAQVICAQCREGDGPKTTQAVSFFLKLWNAAVNEERCARSGMSLRSAVGSLFFTRRP